MNIINRFFLRILLLPSSLYQKMGVNTAHLKAILTAKLVMDDRRPNPIRQAQRRKQQKPVNSATISTMFFTALMGCIFLVSFGVGKDYLTRFTIYFSFYIFILASTLISDFTSVLIDVRDNMIILPKPINDKTFLLARLLHIVIHVSKMVLPMTIPAMIYLGIKEGMAGFLAFSLLAILVCLFTIFLINALYVLILKVTTPEKFKNIISYFQIVFAIFFYGGYQLVPRLISKAALSNYSISSSSWAWITPPYWFAGSWQFLRYLDMQFPMPLFFLLSIVVPLASIWVVIRYFAPSFNQKLSLISGSDGDTAAVKPDSKTVKTTTSVYIKKLAGWLTQNGAERMAFLHTWKMTARSRDFKMKVYPSLGYLVVYFFIMFMNEKKLSLAQIRDQSAGPGKFLFISVIYFSSLILIMAMQHIIYSEKFKASWIYHITPVDKPGKLISGAVKAAIVKFYIPLVTITCITAILIIGPSVIPNLLLGVCNQLLISGTTAYLIIKDLPFSVQQANAAKGGSFVRGLFSMMVPAIIAISHYFFFGNLPVIIIFCILSGIACWLIQDAIKNKGWETIRIRNYE